MSFKSLFKNSMFILFVAFSFVAESFAYDIPQDGANVPYFYVFGPQGEPLNGREDSSLNIFIDVPKGVSDDVVIQIYDADTSGRLDGIASADGSAPETITEYTVSGASQLVSKSVGADKSLDSKWLKLGSFQPSQGKDVGAFNRFTLAIRATNGFDQNLFKVRIKPNSSDAFSDNITFRLAYRKGDEMFFFPQVGENASKIVVDNFDLDKEGGRSSLYDPLTRTTYDVNDSTSGKWAKTEIAIQPGPTRRLKYIVEKSANQMRGNAGVRFLDASGNELPVYFHKGKKVKPVKVEKPKPKPAPEPKPGLACGRFTFDARNSYDPNNDKITYKWDLGDGTVTENPVVSHQYNTAGTYKVVLTVTDNSGLQCNTNVTSQTVQVNTPPNASFAGPDLTCAGSSVTFDASATKDNTPANLSYYWTFGDGTSAEGAKVTKKFDKGGNYDVVLHVDDNSGTSCATDSYAQKIRVNTNPVADAGADATAYLNDPNAEYLVVLDGSKSHDPDGDALSYHWDFGDGNRGEGKKAQHVYSAPGQYQAKLMVKDSSGTPCSTAVDTVDVFLNKSPLAVAGQDQYTCSGRKLSFDASGSQFEGGESPSYHWDFGDGSSAKGKAVSHSYASGGNYKVVLTVDDNKGTPVSQSVDTVNVFVNSTPRVDLSGVGKSCVLDAVTFDASGSSDPDGDKLKYRWDFGDGTVVEGGSKMSHKYTKGGTYRVRVTADDGRGSDCSLASDAVTVEVNTPPTANAGPNLACCQDQQTQFDGSSSSDPDGDKLSYTWNFGDGQTATGPRVSHVFRESGEYRVDLTVDDGKGVCSVAASSFVAKVNSKPVPVIKIKQG